ncbi:LLM class flavin-dependent oxidoreductase [Actinosynnema pretiosum subsp. pretiosum]|uniref:LLM class flavin-dependent oxidoreductase n=1 Tax=Actinosynnema pretiosum subsp. pretiosum TaxID=103721 RepID=A0AA45L6I5_9PSEU|nr:Alkanal monooxygenase alpha chain [Actinosynnema pretiosum subsp. pretiosum]QUF04085.1 LLM class flavin-dependent oxidoreductase [Actinosynnema pretiosum subsp. pretiosum]
MHVGYEASFQSDGHLPDDEFVRRAMDYCLRAESLGFDSIWLTEHHFSDYGLIGDPLQALSYLAGRTERVRLGTAVLVLPWHDPVRVAEQVLLADHLSGGRIVPGIGRGLSKSEYEGMRVPIEQSRAIFQEHAELLLGALEDGMVAGGERIAQPARELRPRPLKSFRGRVLSASVSPASAPLMAKLGVGLMFVIVKPVELMRVDLENYRTAWREEHGADDVPPQPTLSAVVVVDESADRAHHVAMKYERSSHRIAVDHYGMADPDFGDVPGYEYYRRMRTTTAPVVTNPPATVIHGTPQQVLERLYEYKRHLDMQALLTIFHGLPFEDGERSLRCFVDRCLPELRSWPAQPTF